MSGKKNIITDPSVVQQEMKRAELVKSIDVPKGNNSDVIYGSVPGFEEFAKAASIEQAYGYTQMQKSKKGYGAVSSPSTEGGVSKIKGLQDPSNPLIGNGYGARGIREKISRITYPILRECGHRVAVIRGIQNTRTMQIRPFAQKSFNPDDQGFRARLKDPNSTPDSKDKKNIKEIEDFFTHCGYKDFNGWEKRRYKHIFTVLPMLSTEMMTIDQIAITFRKNRKGQILDFHILDAALIKPTAEDRGYEGDVSIKYVQEINGKVTAKFKEDEILFYYHNPRAGLLEYGFGYSYIEQCIDIITGWMYAMSYNKEVFNSSTMPKGFIGFEEGKLDQTELEELQRQWITMFRGVKGMWRTPFLQYKAKWNPVAPSNRDMEWDKYTQWLASWVCAIHGMDSQEMGIRLNGAQNVLNENAESKIAYSKDRGLKELLSFHEAWMNLVKERKPEWEDYCIEFTGVEARDQQAELDVTEKQVKTYRTINEVREENDLEPIEGGDIIDNPSFIQNKMQMDAMAEGGEEGMEGEPGEGGDEGMSDEELSALENASDEQIEQGIKDSFKSEDVKESFNYIEVSLD